MTIIVYCRWIYFMGTNIHGFYRNGIFVGIKIREYDIFLHKSYRNRSFVDTGIRISGYDPPPKP